MNLHFKLQKVMSKPLICIMLGTYGFQMDEHIMELVLCIKNKISSLEKLVPQLERQNNSETVP